MLENEPKPTSAHLFAGAGGGLLTDLILGHTPLFAMDNDHACCENLRRNKQKWFPELSVDCADIRTFDPSKWAGRVDIINAGIPCPRWSSARRMAGETFDRWDDVLRITAIVSPKYLFLECVPSFAKEHERVKNDLEREGYGITKPLIFDAAALGAPHYRKRYWAIAYAHDQSESMRSIDAKMAVLPPVDCGLWWETPPGIPRVDDGMADRVYRFKATGNGQVPAQAAAAWILLGGPVSIE